MAVQAQQYPATILFPTPTATATAREEQDVKPADFLLLPMQPQPSAFAEQSFLVNGGGGNTNPNPNPNTNANSKRKRPAEQALLMDDTAAAAAQFDPVPGGIFSLQLPQDLPFSADDHSLLCKSQRTQIQRLQHQPSLVSTGLHLQLPLQHQHQPQQQQTLLVPSSYSIADDLADSLRVQQDELDRLLHAQTEHLRRAMADTGRRHLQALLAAAEESTARRLRDKEAELDKAKRRTADLEQRIAQTAAQASVWRDKARANVVVAASLQAQIRQATADQAALAAVEDPVGSDAESACVDPRREEREAGKHVRVPCRRCRRGEAVVVVLPCRHLCVCRSCETAVQACPVCFCARSACVEVYLS